jgi:hypothetical protein
VLNTRHVVSSLMCRNRGLLLKYNSGQCTGKLHQKNTIASWFKRFIETGSVAHTKYGQGRPGVADNVAERVRRSYERHLLASRELHIPTYPTVYSVEGFTQTTEVQALQGTITTSI